MGWRDVGRALVEMDATLRAEGGSPLPSPGGPPVSRCSPVLDERAGHADPPPGRRLLTLRDGTILDPATTWLTDPDTGSDTTMLVLLARDVPAAEVVALWARERPGPTDEAPSPRHADLTPPDPRLETARVVIEEQPGISIRRLAIEIQARHQGTPFSLSTAIRLARRAKKETT